MLLREGDTFILHLSTSSEDVLLKKKKRFPHKKSFSTAENRMFKWNQQQFAESQKNLCWKLSTI